MPFQPPTCDRLLQSLNGLLEEEDGVFDEKVTNTCHGWKERCQVVSWLWWLNKKLENNAEVLACAVEILDRFLGIVKVQWKYMKCVAVASYHIALDLAKESNDVPSIVSLIEKGGCSFGSKDASRMENIIRTKLGENPKTPSAFDFLEVIVDLLCIQHKDAIELEEIQSDAFFDELCNLLQMCLCASRFSRYKNSTLAISIVSVVVARYLPDWFPVHAPIICLIKTTTIDFLQCREVVKNAALIKKHPKYRRRQNVSKCPSLTPIIESPFEREFSQHCEREALKEMRKNNVNVTFLSERKNQMKKPKVESHFSRPCDDTDDILPAAKRPRKGLRHASQHSEDGNEMANVKCLRL